MIILSGHAYQKTHLICSAGRASSYPSDGDTDSMDVQTIHPPLRTVEGTRATDYAPPSSFRHPPRLASSALKYAHGASPPPLLLKPR